MITDPREVARLASEREDENWRFRTFLKGVSSIPDARLDAMAEEFGRRAEARMDCTTCGACCRDNVVPLTDDEAERLASRVRLPVLSFHEHYTTRGDDGDTVIDAKPCPFLEGNLCSVHEDRPEPCRGYPYIGGNVRSRLIAIIERAGTCPIVFEMIEQLKRRLRFDRYC